MGCHFFLQRIFPTQGSNPDLPHCRQMLYHLSHQGSLISERVKSLSCLRLFATPWTVAHQAPPSIEFSRQEYWSGVPLPSPGDLPDPGIKPGSPTLLVDIRITFCFGLWMQSETRKWPSQGQAIDPSNNISIISVPIPFSRPLFS